jgi:hypothetical protein
MANLKSPPLHHLIGERKTQVLHTRLRLGCGSLSHDLFCKSIVNDSHSSCGNIETINQYLLSCPKFKEIFSLQIFGILQLLKIYFMILNFTILSKTQVTFITFENTLRFTS